MIVRKHGEGDLPAMREIWNAIVIEGTAFPQTGCLSLGEAEAFFDGQTYNGVAELDGEIGGLYILHPNNIGRCGHIANASYAVKADKRGLHIGEKLVVDSLETAKRLGFRIMQFNAVVATNERALRLYRKLGFMQLGVIPKGFRLDDGSYADICPFYKTLT